MTEREAKVVELTIDVTIHQGFQGVGVHQASYASLFP